MVKIVVIDDEKWIRKLIIKLLPYDKFSLKVVGEAENGEEGLKLIRDKKPNIVLTDIRMPGISGLDLISEINKITNSTRIIIISGYDIFEYAQKAIKLGVVDFVLKPVEEGELENSISKAIKQLNRDKRINRSESLEKQVKRLEYDFVIKTTTDFSYIKNDKIKKVLMFIEENFQNQISLENVSDVVLMNRSYLSETFKKEVGIGFNKYLITKRFDASKKLLINNMELTITDIASIVGFIDANYFSRLFKRYFKCTPQDFRNKYSTR
ncbi:response regulator [Thiospirochaeta perfilievii]|uniref:Response regulator n=1 Tax=Thiospirochaeta perfilievii TaxID=252967 RepID=A0A5C1Q9M3_9SPIO|nr:response regulator [Thiospirochaeta perfilievii]QEN04048.1 response regulator [Thiospirochaeta perfilievii]